MFCNMRISVMFCIIENIEFYWDLEEIFFIFLKIIAVNNYTTLEQRKISVRVLSLFFPPK